MSIIPDPGSPPDVTPTATPLALPGGTFTIASGTKIYSIDLMELYFVEGDGVSLVNNGVVWMEAPSVPTDGSQPIEYRVLLNNQAFFDDVSIVNNGLIYIGGEGNVDIGGWTRYSRTSLVNTGSIFAVSENFQARAITNFGLPSSGEALYVENSGLIAAQTLGDDSVSVGAGQAIAIETYSGRDRNQIINHASGRILAEAPNLAIAISVFGPDAAPDKPVVDNAGLIEAAATDPQGASFGVYLLHSSTIVNSGTIRAQFAIWGAGADQNPAQHVINQAGGQIFGAVALNFGDDVFQNDGTVTGPVQMGFDDDHFFGSGKVNGWVDMGWGTDLFEGSGNSDRAAGGRDDDLLRGNGGRDLLFGGFGDDTLHGDGGNDGLIGEWGDDTIYTLGGDYVEGGADRDRIVLGDYTFERADGGDGFDVLVMANGARNFSLAQMVLGGRVTGFEAIELKANQQLAVTTGSIASFSGGGTTLWVDSAASNTVQLAGSWARGADIDYEGAAYEVWTQGRYTVLASEASTVTANSAPAYGGFDAVAAGTAALRPGAAAGLDYTDPVFLMTGLEIHAPDGIFTVHADEVFHSPNPGTILYSYDVSIFINNGEIYAFGETGTANGPSIANAEEFTNNGLIYVETAGDPYYSDPYTHTIGASTNYRLTNNADILVYSRHGPVMGVYEAGLAINSGLVSAISDAGQAIGLEGVSGRNEFVAETPGQRQFLNTGVIYAEGNGPDYSAIHEPVSFDTLLYYSASAVGVRGVGTLTNDGLIAATLGANAGPDAFTIGIFTYHFSGAPQTGIVNNGAIEGTYAIVFGRDSTASNYVENYGLITGDILFFHGNDIYEGSAGELHGTVFGFGGNDILIGGASDEIFDGGDGDDLMDGAGGSDMASYAASAMGVSVNLSLVTAQVTGQGRDTLSGIENLTGSNFNDTLTGNGFANVLLGSAGADTLQGGAGDDTIVGGAGADTLRGGDGADVFVYSTPSDSTALERDWLKDFVHGTDRVDVRAVTTYGFTFEQFNAGTANAWTRVTIATTDAPLVLRIDGVADLMDFLYLLSGQDLAGTPGDDTLQGSPGPDRLDGLGGNDGLTGLDGNDVLVGGTGADLMIGGLGDDAYVVDDVGDVVVENPGEGTDSVQTTLANFTLSANVENLAHVGAGAFAGTGNSLANRLSGGAGDDEFHGLAGNDVLAGGEGRDLLDGGTGVDTADYSSAAAGVTVRLDSTSAQNTGGAGIDTLANIERLTGSAFADRLTGNTLANTLDGGNGNDILNGGAGNDTMRGGAGDDQYYVDAAGDTTIELPGQGIDTVRAGVDYVLGDEVENLTLLGSARNGGGNDLANVMVGNGQANALEGGGGDDRLYGADGQDRLGGGAGQDTLNGGIGDDLLLGGDGDDALYGGDGEDVLNGQSGNDTLNGQGGADRMFGRTGDDTYYVDDIGDVVEELANQGRDTIVSSMDRTLDDNVEDLVLTGSAESGLGNTLANRITGNLQANRLSGLAGEDVLLGSGGRDTLDGGAGNDLLEGGAGKDLLTGGAGRDVFQFRDGDMGPSRPLADTITDFSQADAEKIHLQLIDANTTLGGNQAFAFIGNGAFTGVAGQLHYAQQAGTTYVEGDTNGDGTADFAIALTGLLTLVASDFVL